MSSVTKNPLYLQSANYIYSFFLSNDSKIDLKPLNTLEIISSDKDVLRNLKRENNKKKYNDFEKRYSVNENE
jgi:hypothetical protein